MNPTARPRRLLSMESAFVVAALLLVLLTGFLEPVVSTALAIVLLVAAFVAWEVVHRGLRVR